MAEAEENISVEPEREPDYEFLDPDKIRLFRSDLGWLRLVVEDDRCYLDVKVVRTFPLSNPDRFYGLLNSKDKVIGMVMDPSKLDKDSRNICEEELKRRYFTPIIRKLVRMKEEYGAVYCEVETNMGNREFVVKGIRDAILDLGDGRVLIMDVDGNRYMVEDWPGLDLKSRRLLESVL
ncbi:MAG: DUF1854 domain-containing protein [Theionarchaea archaeon]|nr:DUF1854 domain-containing protein [Theionarchaea archaeon]